MKDIALLCSACEYKLRCKVRGRLGRVLETGRSWNCRGDSGFTRWPELCTIVTSLRRTCPSTKNCKLLKRTADGGRGVTMSGSHTSGRQCPAHFTHFAHTWHIWHTWGNFARKVHPLCTFCMFCKCWGAYKRHIGSADSPCMKFCTPHFLHFCTELLTTSHHQKTGLGR